ncbi:hypothetical protein BH10ACT6_BH10ACT6_09790 [soil metagenome]
MSAEFLDLEVLLLLCAELGELMVRDVGLLDAAAQRPRTYLYPLNGLTLSSANPSGAGHPGCWRAGRNTGGDYPCFSCFFTARSASTLT